MQFWLKLNNKIEEKLIKIAKAQGKSTSDVIEEHFLNSFTRNESSTHIKPFTDRYKPDDTAVGLPCSEIYADYLEWCAENNTQPYSPKAFGRRCGKNVLGISYSRANVRYRRCVRTM